MYIYIYIYMYTHTCIYQHDYSVAASEPQAWDAGHLVADVCDLWYIIARYSMSCYSIMQL